jgi:hypothetical protein
MKRKVSAVTSSQLFVDEIEDDLARLVAGEVAFTVPRALLPPETREGDWLTIRLTRTPPPSDDTPARREHLGKDDPGGDIKL